MVCTLSLKLRLKAPETDQAKKEGQAKKEELKIENEANGDGLGVQESTELPWGSK